MCWVPFYATAWSLYGATGPVSWEERRKGEAKEGEMRFEIGNRERGFMEYL